MTCSQAISVESGFHDARFELEDCETQVKNVIEALDLPDSDRALKPYGETVSKLVDNFEFAFRSNSNKFRKVKAAEKKPITEKGQLVSLQARVKTAQLRVKSAERRWRNLLIQVKFLQVFHFILFDLFVLIIVLCFRVYSTVHYDQKNLVGVDYVLMLFHELKHQVVFVPM